MSYTLGLLFKYHRYRHDAIMRIYADDCLVDELSLSSDINTKIINVTGMYNSFIGPRNETPLHITPEKLFLFEINEQHLFNRIRIEMQNDHNNNTNGFMTEFSYVAFHEIFLLPSCLLENKNHKRIKKKIMMKWGTEFPLPPKDIWPRRVLPHEIILKPDPRTNNNIHWVHHSIGGSFSMEIPLSRKHGVIHLGKLNPGRICFNGRLSRILWSFNL